MINKPKNWRTNISVQPESGLRDKLFCMDISNFCTYIIMGVDEVWHPESLKNDKRVEKNELTGLRSMLKFLRMNISGMDGVQYELFKSFIDNLFTKIQMEEVLF